LRAAINERGNMNNDDFSNKPNKNSLNMLAYFGKRKFNVWFLAFYLLGGVVVVAITNFVLDGARVTPTLWFGIIPGLIIGAILYAWDLRQAQKKG
jgi:hypothetical protein